MEVMSKRGLDGNQKRKSLYTLGMTPNKYSQIDKWRSDRSGSKQSSQEAAVEWK